MLRVQYFQQRRAWVAPEVFAQLIYFIEYKYRIGRFYLAQLLYDTAGHSTYVGLSMAAQLTFIMQPTQAQAHILALYSTGYAASQRGLTDARRAYKA